jgi:hypothetical protein
LVVSDDDFFAVDDEDRGEVLLDQLLRARLNLGVGG